MQRLLQLTLAVVFILSFTQCQHARHRQPVGSHVTWPKVAYTQVYGFAYHCDAEISRNSIQSNGQITRGILQPGKVTLNADQVQRLLQAVQTPQPKSWRTPCYVPHHAFHFVDAKDRVVAYLDVCLSCNKHLSGPHPIVEYPDMTSLHNIIQELQLPVGSGKYFYRDLYKAQGEQLAQP